MHEWDNVLNKRGSLRLFGRVGGARGGCGFVEPGTWISELESIWNLNNLYEIKTGSQIDVIFFFWLTNKKLRELIKKENPKIRNKNFFLFFFFALTFSFSFFFVSLWMHQCWKHYRKQYLRTSTFIFVLWGQQDFLRYDISKNRLIRSRNSLSTIWVAVFTVVDELELNMGSRLAPQDL